MGSHFEESQFFVFVFFKSVKTEMTHFAGQIKVCRVVGARAEYVCQCSVGNHVRLSCGVVLNPQKRVFLFFFLSLQH